MKNIFSPIDIVTLESKYKDLNVFSDIINMEYFINEFDDIGDFKLIFAKNIKKVDII